MLTISLELAKHDPVYGDIASKFFEHFVHINAAMNTLGGSGLWDAEDGFYYDGVCMLPPPRCSPSRCDSSLPENHART